MPTQEEMRNRDDGAVLLERTGAVAVMTLSRPAFLNALTWGMYEQMESHLKKLAHDDAIRVVILRGAGKAFASGTDITYFQGFTAKEGLIYEKRIESIISGLYDFPKPTIAALHGYAVGAGAILAAGCDLRYATPATRFGAPIARTLGNCLSIKNYQRLVDNFGLMQTRKMLLTSQLFPASEALQCGFLTAIIEEDRIFSQVFDIARQISTLAPLTIWATKEAHKRLYHGEGEQASFDDVLARIYNSHDFAEGVQAYVEKRKPNWHGR